MEQNNNKPTRNETAHGSLLACGGGYTIYMAYRMVENTRTGLSSMSMSTTWTLAAVLGIGGAVVLGYGLWLMYRDWKRQNKKD